MQAGGRREEGMGEKSFILFLLSLPLPSLHSYKYKMHAPPCDASCRAGAICGLVTTRQDDPSACTDLPAGVTMEDIRRHQLMDNMC